jgi:hypothetical protein
MSERAPKLELLVMLFVRGSAKKPPTKAEARKALLPILKAQHGDAEAKRRIDAALDACVEGSELEPVSGAGSARFRLTAAGTARLEAEFGKLEGASWPLLRDRYAIRGGLADGTQPLPNLASFVTLRAVLAARSAGIDYRPGMSDTAILNRIAAKAAGSSRADKTAIRTALIRTWLGADGTVLAAPPAQSTQTHSETAFDLHRFAVAVNEAAREAPSGRWGSNKVFVNHVWREFTSRAAAGAPALAAFKRHLLEANRQGLLRLSRADLVISMPEDDVRDSEITTVGDDVFHFVTI